MHPLSLLHHHHQQEEHQSKWWDAWRWQADLNWWMWQMKGSLRCIINPSIITIIMMKCDWHLMIGGIIQLLKWPTIRSEGDEWQWMHKSNTHLCTNTIDGVDINWFNMQWWWWWRRWIKLDTRIESKCSIGSGDCGANCVGAVGVGNCSCIDPINSSQTDALSWSSTPPIHNNEEVDFVQSNHNCKLQYV